MSEGGPDYRAAFDAASPRFYPGEAEYELDCGDRTLTLSLPAVDDAPVSAAIDTAHDLLPRIDRLDSEATAWLKALPGWPYGDDAVLWLLLVEPTNVRFCYRQVTVNDEQVVGFARTGAGWTLIGADPRFRAPFVPL